MYILFELTNFGQSSFKNKTKAIAKSLTHDNYENIVSNKPLLSWAVPEQSLDYSLNLVI